MRFHYLLADNMADFNQTSKSFISTLISSQLCSLQVQSTMFQMRSLIFLVIILPFASTQTVLTQTCKTEVGNTNQLYSRSISGDTTYLFVFPIEVWRLGDPVNMNIRVEAHAGSGATLDCPIIFAVGQQQRLTGMELPFSYGRNRSNIYYEAARTLCVADSYRQDMRNITVRVSTCSQRLVNYGLKVSVSQNYLLPLDQEIRLDVSPTSPVVRGFLYDRHKDLSSVKISAASSDNICMTISVQPFECPVYYEEFNVQYRGLWQTMTQKAAMTVEESAGGRFEQGFALALVVHDVDDRCHQSPKSKARLKSSVRQKYVRIKISSDGELSSWILLLCLAIPVAGSLLVIILTVILFRWRHDGLKKRATEIDVTDSFAIHKTQRSALNSALSEEAVSLESLNGTRNTDETDHVAHKRLTETPTIRVITGQADVCIGDFSRGQAGVIDRKSRRFCWALITVAVFYTIPVYQLLFHYLKVLYKTGEYDLCYYIYLCAYRVGYLLDFNHFFSNIGYVIFGLAFIWIVHRRDANVKVREDSYYNNNRKLSRPRSTMEIHTAGEEEKSRCLLFFPVIETKPGFGVPQHYGVYYSLGLALIMEGLLSAAYHVCPNQNNFQFDTSFMYVISMLTILKIYQFRHPVALDANQTFGILAAVVLVSVAGLLLEFGGSDSVMIHVFRICFMVAQFGLLIALGIYMYTLGYVKDEANVVATDLRLLKRLKHVAAKPIRLDRLALPVMSILLCIAVVIYTEMTQTDFATYLLYTFIANVLGAVLYYVVLMKPLNGEYKHGLWIQPTLYFATCGVVGGFAVYYFLQTPAMWEKSASESRSENNMACMTSWFPFQPFYDVHDVWHFLSAVALFMAFMGLLTVDDDLISTPQSRIPVF